MTRMEEIDRIAAREREAERRAAEKAKALEAEAYETPRWAVDAILDVEILTHDVVDIGAGRGMLMDAARERGYRCVGIDKYDWGRTDVVLMDFLEDDRALMYLKGTSVLMNPPFSLAQQFVTRCLNAGARKVVCFQRFAWWESEGRREFWQREPPSRVYICGSRATCWRYDITEEEKTHMGRSSTAHAWFVWEPGHPPGTLMGHIYK